MLTSSASAKLVEVDGEDSGDVLLESALLHSGEAAGVVTGESDLIRYFLFS